MASGQACNSVKEVGSSLTCLPPLRGLLGTLSSVVESLSCSYSCSYDESVSIMVLQYICQVYVWFGLKMINECFVFIAEGATGE